MAPREVGALYLACIAGAADEVAQVQLLALLRGEAGSALGLHGAWGVRGRTPSTHGFFDFHSSSKIQFEVINPIL